MGLISAWVLDCKRSEIRVHSKFPNPNENTNMPYTVFLLGREDIAPMLKKIAISEVNQLNWEVSFLNPVSQV
jgi:hypothetical protein